MFRKMEEKVAAQPHTSKPYNFWSTYDDGGIIYCYSVIKMYF